MTWLDFLEDVLDPRTSDSLSLDMEDSVGVSALESASDSCADAESWNREV